MADITQRLPPGLFIKILCHVSTPDVLRVKQVNRVFHDTILASPLVQLKIDLFVAGLKRNTKAEVSLAESKKALLQYCSSLGSLCPIEEKVVENVQAEVGYWSRTTGGMHAVFTDSVRLFSLGSASRGISYKEWKIPSPIDNPIGYCIYPGANLIAFVERQTYTIGYIQVGIHLRALSDGGHHPAAQFPTIQYSRAHFCQDFPHFISATGSRLAMLADSKNGKVLVIWDWKSAQLLFELEREHYKSAEFIDDYRLLVVLGPTSNLSPCIALFDTEDVEETPTQTTFHLSPQFKYSGGSYLLLEQGVHGPSPEESLVPFYPDPAQRIVMLNMQHDRRYLAICVGALLEFKSRGEAEIGWDEWKHHVVVPRFVSDQWMIALWVSGCRLFSVFSTQSDPDAQMQVYDFSPRGRAQYLSEETDQSFGGLRYLSPTKARARIPWDRMVESCSGHDSIVFSRQADGEDIPENQYVLHIWVF